ncbi:hypothetical protein GHT07_00120 [Caenimonas koreensis DSM 17982]|uniref:Type I secretion C-terminal target domain (VC_A0849 subclass) n=1 Tax=Caenimonas koreensis DSM 17982 TaxID=1121255 RepID=A0A844ATK1_9BURK|nr:hypothetical protein [Caenimonas koreensis]MRD45668.1 hypothetical protein [Caenimonas koreensis DSM 17982]
MRVIFSSDEFNVSDGDFVFGDSDGTPEFVFSGGDDVFYGEDGPYQYGAVGDAYALDRTDRGGNDTFYGGDFAGSFSDGPAPNVTALVPIFNVRGAVTFIGDAIFMTDGSTGGRDYAQGGVNSNNLFIGDASDADGLARGGNDTLMGGDAGWSEPRGRGLTAATRQSDSTAFNVLIGDFAEAGGRGPTTREVIFELPSPKGGQDSIVGGDAWAYNSDAGVSNVLIGDAYALGALAKAGDDTVRGGTATASDATASAYNIIVGDAFFMTDGSRGGRDALYGGNVVVTSDSGDGYAINLMSGDNITMDDGARGGADFMVGGSARSVVTDGKEIAAAINLMAGDTFSVRGSDVDFGRDTMVGGSGTGDGYAINVMFGDIGASDAGGLPFPFPFFGQNGAISLAGLDGSTSRGSYNPDFHFAADKLTGGNGNAMNYLVGDAEFISSDSTGGDDTLFAGDGYSSTMYGDSLGLAGKGGNDKLYSGKGNDDMWGDAQKMGESADGGADRFYFGVKNGDDTIHDFRVGDKDKIDLSAFSGLSPDFKNFASLKASGRLEQVSDGVVLHLDLADKASDHNTVLIVGVDLDELVKASFAFG